MTVRKMYCTSPDARTIATRVTDADYTHVAWVDVVTRTDDGGWHHEWRAKSWHTSEDRARRAAGRDGKAHPVD